ncbi:zf-DHHC-domain-containing protein [Aspergillus sclerotioniger CBS 115572]|uniref:Palmitoyltransferase n=1 Tax=Aspergillus sclerotioniger CBS 115572 TaxID=1450535 RepID=A0A317XDQ6_9EURO|nr:zf-DHHC-domain-containing protein [Aspergillus sclerotioniger CBS 115572]PWY96465.1 zf-DHHC-domain-containing protein [Aspergillus sclerotioniger CBS 115572]
MARPDKRINVAVARAIPPFLLCVSVYASYIVTKPLCIDYLIRPLPKYHRSSRVGAGAAILAIFYILIIVVITTYLRLLYNVVRNPGYLPRAPPPIKGQDTEPSDPQHRKKKRHRNGRTPEKPDKSEVDIERGVDCNADGGPIPLDTTALENFYTKDVFVCQEDGRPLYCSTCCHYKTDRAHHCREVDRCVLKMDHFCPWVGGVVSETSFKFFIQFVFYTMLFCTFSLIVCATFTAEMKRQTGGANVHLAIGIGLCVFRSHKSFWLFCLTINRSSLFGLFTFGMTLSSLQLAMLNMSTIENLNRRSAVWTLAIRVPNKMLAKLNPESRWAPTFRTITYPLPPASLDPEAAREYQPAGEKHVFAILQTLPGENPFDLGSPFRNLQQVLGYSIIDWLLPFKQSPCADRTTGGSFYELGPVVSRLKKEAGLEPPREPQSTQTDTHKRHKRRHSTHRQSQE